MSSHFWNEFYNTHKFYHIFPLYLIHLSLFYLIHLKLYQYAKYKIIQNCYNK